MCLAFPAKIVSLHGDGTATVSLGEVKKVVSLALDEDAALGDYLLVHAGFALSRLDDVEAERTLALLHTTAAGKA